ncbi:MAG TPA: MerR family transcriptional regulator [Sphingomonadaceae bacterium]|nr:MerR family transcriptional regulator [Sphingomonadaceae bacterium]
MTIGGLAREGGVGVETVRFYQRRGLLEEPRRGGGVRRYGPEHVRKLRFIRSAQSAGFTLAEIGHLTALDATEDRTEARRLATARLEALDATIAELQRARHALEHLVGACAAGAAGPCPIIDAFDGASERTPDVAGALLTGEQPGSGADPDLT